ncbi:MAG: TonB-dependent receptor [Prolixibacteraceae bacterium]
MKKRRMFYAWGRIIAPAQKIGLKMKLTLFFLLFGFLNLMASESYSQLVKLNISLKNATVEQVLAGIEENSEYNFVYNRDVIDLQRKLDVNYRDVKVSDILDDLFRGTNVKYRFIDRTIVLSAAPVATVSMQPQQVSGKITDASGVPLPGVAIALKGTSQGTISDSDGNYALSNVPANAVLVYSFVGMRTQEVTVDGKTVINLTMTEETLGIEEVVAIGYGTQRKEVVTGSISMTKGTDIQKSPAQNIGQSLQGRLSGVVMNNRSGEPGSDGVSINIRGLSTTRDSNPLILIDGIANRGSLERLNPNDIESITILKDASGAIYGSRSANGVILVTTKRGKEGSPSINYSFNVGLQQPTRLPEMADAATYAEAMNEMNSYEGRDPMYTSDEISKFRNGSDPIHYPNTNWLDETMRSSSLQYRHNLSLSGGSEKVKYFVGGGYSDQNGIYKNSATYYKQYDIRSNIDAEVAKYLNVSVDLAGRLEDRHYSGMDAGNIFWAALRAFPTVLARYPNGLPTSGGLDIGNPVTLVTDETGYRKNKRSVFNGTVSANLDLSWLLKGLSVDGVAAYDKVGVENKEWLTPYYYYVWDEATDVYEKRKNGSRTYASLRQDYQPSANFTLNAKLKYKNTFNVVHGVDIMVGFEQNEYTGNDFWASRSNYISTAIDQLFAGSSSKENYDNGGSAYEQARQSYFGRAAYDYAGKYMVQFNFRYDGSYIFPEDNRWGFFPGVSIGWRLSEEEFIKNNLDWMNNLKIRASYGQQGNDNVGAFQYLLNYTSGRNYVFNNTDVEGVYQSGFPNPNITWEVANTYNIGLDGTFFNGLIGFETDVFKTTRSNILTKRNASIPQYTGLKDLPDENIGEVENKGIEVQLTHVSKIGEVNLNVSGNFMYARNKVIYMDETPWGEGYDYLKAEGQPINAGLYYRTIGIFRDQEHLDSYPHYAEARPGDLIFEDVDGNKEINSMDRVRYDLTNFPEIVFGMTIGAAWKNFDLSMLLQGQARARQAIYARIDATSNAYKYRTDDRWTPDNIDGTMPRAGSATINFGDSYPTDFWLKDASFLRLKNLELGYTLPSRWFSKIPVSNFRVYVNGYNLLTLDKIKIIDPESSSAGGFYYPQVKIFNAGLSLTF